ncbi:MAG: phytase [Myxococcales bacterium]|nr:MAG: phytase [Myxococcales bacterium]
MRNGFAVLTALGLIGASACGTDSGSLPSSADEAIGEMEVALTNAPRDVSCVRISVVGSRTDVRKLDLAAGRKASFTLSGLPVGVVSVSADAFPVACNQVTSGSDASWYSEAVGAKLKAGVVAHVALSMIHNGKASVGVDFDDDNAPTQPSEPPVTGGTFSSAKAYMLPAAPGVKVKAILTAGDAVGLKPDGVTPYRMVGIPDGTGAFDNGDGTFTWLVNHEISSGGVARAHGGKGAFVSKWSVRKADLAVLKGEDLGKQAVLWNVATSAYDAPNTTTVFQRFCSADLAAPSAFFYAAGDVGYDAPLFLNGEESGSEGRGMAHDLEGNMWEVPRLGKLSWENSVASPKPGLATVVAGTDDAGGGQIYIYAGTKTSTGSAVDKAGLTNGVLYGLRVVGQPTETATGIPTGRFELHAFGNVENTTGAQLDTDSNTNLVTKFNRPEDAAWDPNSPNDLYFVTTNAFTAPSRLWRARFIDVQRPELGGTFEMLLDGTEGTKMLDNMAFDKRGHIYLQEDVGGNVHLGRVLRYDIETDTLTPVLQADPQLFDSTLASPTFITIDEEASGVIDASALLGAGWFLSSMQVHKASSDPELVEGGQLFAFYDPAAAE